MIFEIVVDLDEVTVVLGVQISVKNCSFFKSLSMLYLFYEIFQRAGKFWNISECFSVQDVWIFYILYKKLGYLYAFCMFCYQSSLGNGSCSFSLQMPQVFVSKLTLMLWYFQLSRVCIQISQLCPLAFRLFQQKAALTPFLTGQKNIGKNSENSFLNLSGSISSTSCKYNVLYKSISETYRHMNYLRGQIRKPVKRINYRHNKILTTRINWKPARNIIHDSYY